jgi:SEC-C motif-containing protein
VKLAANAPCPCGSGRKHKGCCAPILSGTTAPTAEALMRSRYTAYVAGDVGYLIATTDPDGPHFRADRAAWRADLAAYCAAVRFDGLRVLGAEQLGDTGRVRFVAWLRHGGSDATIAEDSRFVRRNGRWLYIDGIPLDPGVQ